MRQSDVELAIGDSVRLENRILTVIDIHGDEITFRLDRVDDDDPTASRSQFTSRRTPR